jgi:hypothetical protein
LKPLKIEGQKDKKYQKELKMLRMEREENEQNILHQEKSILFQKLSLWVPMGLRSEICNGEHDTKVASHMSQDKTKELIK